MADRCKINILWAISIILLLGHIAPVLADSTWTTGGPYDASVHSIAIHPFDSQRLYVGTLGSFIFKTTDGGATWNPTGTPPGVRPAMRSVQSIKIHPFGPDTLFVATFRGTYKSIDAGQIWSQMFPRWPYNTWDGGFEISRANPPVLFLGCWGSAWRSPDGGRTWIQMARDILTGSIKAITADPVSPNIIYLAHNETNDTASIWKSTDAGATWFNIHNNLQYGALSHAFGRDIAVDPINHEIVYFARECSDGLGEALVKSTNGGESWTDITPPNLAENFLYRVAVSPRDHNIIFVCSDMNGILRSINGGETWEEINEGVTGMNTRALSVAFDSSSGVFYHGRLGGGIYRSFDNGDHWEKISYQITAPQIYDLAANYRNPDTLYTTTLNGLYMSIDGANSWEYIELNFPGFSPRCDNVEVDPYDPSYVYMSFYNHDSYTYSGAFYRSTDGGANWESFTDGLLSDRYYGDIAVADHGGGVRKLFMASGEGLFYSNNLGESWLLCRGGLPANINVATIEVSPANPDHIYVGDWLGNLYKSTDGGMSWTQLTNVPDGSSIAWIACDPLDINIIYITLGTNSGIFKSTDSGQSWVDIINNLPLEDEYFLFSGLAINPFNPENVFIWSYNKGIFQSHNGGESWEDFNENLEPTYPSACILIDPTDTCRVFAGVRSSAVWVLDRRIVDINDNFANLPSVFSTSNYPNPFNPSTTIEYNLPEAGQVNVDIFDIIGRKVTTLVNQYQQAGTHQVVWDAGGWASGLYFYKITTAAGSETKQIILLK